MEISQRQLDILKAVIDDYVVSAVPVASRTISRKYMPNFSSATIRNDMADLEDMGYLTQPHTSAGRVPSDSAYRLYVDRMMGEDVLTEEDRKAIQRPLARKNDELEDVIRRTASLVSDMTQAASLVLAPQLRRMTLRRIQLVGLTRGTALVVIVTDAAVVKDAIIHIPEYMTDDALISLSKRLTERFSGHALTDVDLNLLEGTRDEFIRYHEFFETLHQVLEDTVVKNSGQLVVEGASHFLNYPECHDAEAARSFLELLQSKERLFRLMAARTKRECTVTIGMENNEPGLENLSLITTAYRVGNRSIGCIGVLGPTRIDYPRVIQILRVAGKSLGDAYVRILRDEQD